MLGSHCDDTLKLDGSGEEMDEEDEMVRIISLAEKNLIICKGKVNSKSSRKLFCSFARALLALQMDL